MFISFLTNRAQSQPILRKEKFSFSDLMLLKEGNLVEKMVFLLLKSEGSV